MQTNSHVGTSPRTYLIPGLDANYPVFSRILPLLPNATLVAPSPPRAAESLVSYATRIASVFEPDCYIVGVSFGGVLAQEVSHIVRARGCVVVSSIRRPEQLPPWFRIFRRIGGTNCSRALRVVGALACSVPQRMRQRSTIRAAAFAGSRGRWQRWAAGAILNWQPTEMEAVVPVTQIHGDRDTTLPLRYVDPDVVIRHGRHALPVSHPIETAAAITEFINLT